MNPHAKYIIEAYNATEPWNAQKLLEAADEIERLEKRIEELNNQFWIRNNEWKRQNNLAS